jgi:hypothetical protein
MKRLQIKRQAARTQRLQRRAALRAYDRAHLRPMHRGHRHTHNAANRYMDSARGRYAGAVLRHGRPEYALMMRVWRETGEDIDLVEAQQRLGASP